MIQVFDPKEKRRKALQRKQEDKKRRNPIAQDLGSKKYRQRIRELKEKHIPIEKDFDEDSE